MSRTYRNTNGMHKCAYKYPRTENERRLLNGVLHDDELMEYPISKLNHLRSRVHNLPSAWDDRIVSAYYEEDWRAS